MTLGVRLYLAASFFLEKMVDTSLFIMQAQESYISYRLVYLLIDLLRKAKGINFQG